MVAEYGIPEQEKDLKIPQSIRSKKAPSEKKVYITY